MRSFTLLFCLLFSLITANCQTDLSANQWQEDLRFLQKTVHEDYSFLFKKTTKEDFDRQVEELSQAIPDLEDHEVIVGLARIVSSFKYGHTAIGLSGWWEREAFNFHQMPYNLYDFTDGVYIQGTQKEYERSLGAKVLEIEGMPVAEALEAIRPVVPAENDQYHKAFGLNYLGVPEILHAQGVTKTLKKNITLTLDKEGEIFKQTFAPIEAGHFPGRYSLIEQKGDWLDARDQTDTPLYLKKLDRIYFYEYLPEHKTVYIRHSQIQDDPEQAIPEFYAEVFDFIDQNDVERLILDVRLNGGGNNYKNKPIVTGVIQSEKINQPGKFFVIIGRRTFSACQNLVNELDNYTEAIFVGEPTAENINFYGDNRPVVLPNSKITARLSFAWWQDKPQWENGPWTKPHLAVAMSFADYQSNQDPVLQTVLDFSEDNFILDPMAYFTQLYMNGDLEKIESEAKRLVENPMYQFFDFESEFNSAGYDLLGSDQVDPAIFVFQLNTELFPNSANAWDSLGEAHWKAGKTDLAIEYYQKAIALDPDGNIGANAKSMLQQIKRGREDATDH